MKSTKVVNKYKHNPTKKDVYIGRGSIWGNPYTHYNISNTKAKYKVNSRKEAIEKYEQWLLKKLKDKKFRKKLKSLKGSNLVCFCNPKPCHGDILKKYIDMPKKKIKYIVKSTK